MAGLWTEVCLPLPILSAVDDKYEVYFITDASGGASREAHEMAVHRMMQAGWLVSEWGASETNRRARFYRLTRAGRKLLDAEKRDWEQTALIIARFFDVKAEDLA